MRRLLIVLLLIPLLVAPAHGIFSKKEQKLFDEETAIYEQTTFDSTRTILQMRQREGNVITTSINGNVVQTMTQSPDGRVTTVIRPDMPYVFKIVFEQPVFQLPDGSFAQGKQLAVSYDGVTILDESDIFVKVEREGFMSTYTYTVMGDRGISSHTAKYRNNSRLPESAEQIQIEEKVITSYILFIRLHRSR